jgi:hypothetical protein
MKVPINYSLISDIEVEDVFTWDAPDFCDAYISFALYDGMPMTDEQLDALNDDRDFVHQQATNVAFSL